MSRERLAAAYDALAEASAQVAHELRGATNEQPAAGERAPSSPAPAPKPDTTSWGQVACPKHGVPFEKGQYGEYCKQKTDDPAWGKEKTDRDGNKVFWCRITPKNAPQWVAIHAPPPVQDVDDLAF